ncbi:NADAR domain-containing protein [Nocardia sp. NPDC052566]|uniref:NADAR domain-containing protein n=1 Tax=Nocardia sp. NPDC052566 TaxID=3364330 RepID=UPI0037C60E1A
MNVIDRFRGPHQCFSNFELYPVEFEDMWFPSTEHAFHAAKTFDLRIRRTIQAAATARNAKQLGQQLPLRPDWEQVKYSIMAQLQHIKFTTNPQLCSRLVTTGDDLLIEGNSWQDDTWGRCRKPGFTCLIGKNWLGRILMQLRRELRSDPRDRWPRVALTGHREERITPATHPWLRAELARIISKLRDHHGTQVALTGLATGADIWWAQAAEAAGLPFWGYQPFPSQTARWRTDQQAEHVRLRNRAHRLVLVGEHAHKQHFDLRNDLMITDADAVVAVRDPEITSGGTVSALKRYCGGKPVIMIDVRNRRTTIHAIYQHR